MKYMKDMKEIKRKIKGSMMLTCIAIGAICALMLLASTDVQQVVSTIGQKGWNNVATAMGDPGEGNGGILQLCIYPHQGDPGSAYADNLSNESAYAYADELNIACTGNVPYDTTFDIVYSVRYNVTQAYNSSGSVWETAWTQCLITCADLGISTDTIMTGVEIWSDESYLWMNFYMNNGGSGYTITHGQQVNITSFKMQAYY